MLASSQNSLLKTSLQLDSYHPKELLHRVDVAHTTKYFGGVQVPF